MISIIVPTYRPGGMDILASSLFNQIYTDWELIIVDDYEHRQPKELFAYFDDYDIFVAHITRSKAKCYPDTPLGYANAVNSGLLNCDPRTDTILSLQDYIYLPPYFLSNLKFKIEHSPPKTIVVHGGRMRAVQQPDYLGDFTVWYDSKKVLADIPNAPVTETWIPAGYEEALTAFPRQFFVETNGLDERCDYRNVACWNNTMWKIKQLGYQVVVDKENLADMVQHRNWTLGDDKHWHVEKRVKPGTGEKAWDWYKDIRSPNCFEFK